MKTSSGFFPHISIEDLIRSTLIERWQMADVMLTKLVYFVLLSNSGEMRAAGRTINIYMGNIIHRLD